jgi:protoporphyrinogen oxidase
MLQESFVRPFKISWTRTTSFRLSTTLLCRYLSNTAPAEQHKDVAIVGGGITGLATAYFLTKRAPQAKITLYEASSRNGGWIDSNWAEEGDRGRVLFEHGPRTLRTRGEKMLPMAHLVRRFHCLPSTYIYIDKSLQVQDLDLIDSCIFTKKSSPAASRRYLYYPDRLVMMPSPNNMAKGFQGLYDLFWTVLTEPVFKGVLAGAAGEYFRSPRNPGLSDESIGSFLSRRMGSKDFANNMMSAVMHGIYAGDIWQLSAKSILTALWDAEGRYGSITNYLLETVFKGVVMKRYEDIELSSKFPWKALDASFRKNLTQSDVLTFRKGLRQVTDALEERLKENENVLLRYSMPVDTICPSDQVDKVSLIANGNPTIDYDHIVSTTPATQLSNIVVAGNDSLKSKVLSSSLGKIESVTVMVVNLWFESPYLLPQNGFGYLIPRSIPFVQNPECALGVIFDSDTVQGQDTAKGTKLTVMLGGHWWDGFSSYPSQEEGLVMARSVVSRHLKINESPKAWKVTLQKDCIPQYKVGHDDRLKRANHELQFHFHGRLKVAGSSYTGVGVNDCIRAASDVADSIADNQANSTGLERYTAPQRWVAVPRVPAKDPKPR